MGPPPFISFHDISASPGAFILHWGTRFCILYIFPHLFFWYKHLLLQTIAFVVTIGDPLWPHATRVTLGWSIPSQFPLLTSSISSEHNPGLLPLSSAFIFLVPPLAQLTSDLVVPLTLDLVPTVAATPCTSSNQGPSRVIPLFDFIYVPLPPHTISRFHGVPFCFWESRHLFVDISTLFQKGDSILILISHSNAGSRTAQRETPLLPDVVDPHYIRRQHFFMLRWVLLCDYCSFYHHLPKTSELDRATTAHIFVIGSCRDHYHWLRVCSFAALSSAFIIPPLRALRSSTSTIPTFSLQGYITRAWGMPASSVHICILLNTLWKVGLTGSFLLQRIALYGLTLALLYNTLLRKRNIAEFRPYVLLLTSSIRGHLLSLKFRPHRATKNSASSAQKNSHSWHKD
jgi:hypothetical protein